MKNLEEEIDKYKLEIHALKCTFDRRLLELENNEEIVAMQLEVEKQKLTNEKKEIIIVNNNI